MLGQAAYALCLAVAADASRPRAGFKQNRTEIVAPVDPATIMAANESFSVMGITVLINAATSDEVGILGGGLVSVTQLSIKGSIEDGTILATEIRDEGPPKFDEVKLQGPVSNMQPNSAFDLLGVRIEIDNGTQFSGDTLINSLDDFFLLATSETVVEVKGELTVSGSPIITAAEIEIEE